MSAVTYARRQPEHTVLHRVVTARWGAAQELCRDASDGAALPDFIVNAVQRYLGCGDLKRGMVRIHCHGCGQDLFVAVSCKVRGMCPSCDGKRMTEMSSHLVDSVLPAVPMRQWVLSLPYDLRYLLAWNMPLRSAVLSAFMRAVQRHYVQQAKMGGVANPQTGAISVVQRFNSALQLDVHFHVLFADGVWSEQDGAVTFHPAEVLNTLDVQAVILDAACRIARQLKRFGYADDDEPAPFDASDPAHAQLLRAAIQGRQLTGAEAGSPLAAAWATRAAPRPVSRNCAELGGYSLHANTRVHEVARDRLEQLCKYLLRPAVSASRLELLDNGRVRLALKTTWRNGVTHVTMPNPEEPRRSPRTLPTRSWQEQGAP